MRAIKCSILILGIGGCGPKSGSEIVRPPTAGSVVPVRDGGDSRTDAEAAALRNPKPTPVPYVDPNRTIENLGGDSTHTPVDDVPVETLLWTSEELPEDAAKLLDKSGVLRRGKPPKDVDRARTWPFALDYWAITRTDLDALLFPYLGRPVKIVGLYVKIYDHGETIYEVRPYKILLLPSSKSPSP